MLSLLGISCTVKKQRADAEAAEKKESTRVLQSSMVSDRSADARCECHDRVVIQ
jgi:hypothetical protein